MERLGSPTGITLLATHCMTIFYIQYEVAPAPGSENFDTAGGAFVNCWVQATSRREAHERASAAIEESGWTILGIEEQCRETAESEYSEDDDGLEHCRQAITDGECYVFHQWPVEPQEGDDVH